MAKQKPNDKCSCGSTKKYKQCCMKNDDMNKSIQHDKYINGSDTSSPTMLKCIEHYQQLFPQHKIIDISADISPENYRDYQIKNYTNKTIMLVEQIDGNENNFKFFNAKNNYDIDSNLIILYHGQYRIVNHTMLARYDDSIVELINE